MMAPKLANESITDYPEQTTIHGVKYLLSRSRPVADRIFWILIFILSISSLGYFVSKIIRTWMENPVMIVARNRPTPVFEIPFPAVTICPQIKVKRNKLDLSNLQNDIKQFANLSDFINDDLGKRFIMSSQICRRAFREYTEEKLEGSKIFYIEDMPTDWMSTLHDMSPTLDDVFVTCAIMQYDETIPFTRSSKENCRRLFSTVVTNEGICFTFNSIRDILREDELQKDFQYHDIKLERDGWDPENGYTNGITYPYKAIIKGLGGIGFKFIVTANRSDISPFCFPSNIGYKIALHSPSAYPETYENFIPLPFGKEYNIAVIPETVNTADDLRSFAPDVRNCYFNDERKLKFYTFYNEQNCRLECYANYSASIFGGAPFSSPRISNVTNYALPHKNFGWGLPEYFGILFDHYNIYGVPEGAVEFYNDIDCNCLPECNAIHYKHKIIKSNDEFSLEVADDGTNTTDAKIIKTSFEFVFTEPKFIGQKRVRVYTIVSMISDFGGLLGLFMGGSIVSLFELFYFVTIRNCFKPEVADTPK